MGVVPHSITCSIRFVSYDDPLGCIAKLTQTGTIAAFGSEFEFLMLRIAGVSNFLFLNFWIWVLKPDIRRELLLNPPHTLPETMMKSQLFEERRDDWMRASTVMVLGHVPTVREEVGTREP